MFTLWDWRFLDPVAMCETLDEALRIVQSGIERNGPADTDTLALVRDMPDADPVQIAQGAGLAALAEEAAKATSATKPLPTRRQAVIVEPRRPRRLSDGRYIRVNAQAGTAERPGTSSVPGKPSSSAGDNKPHRHPARTTNPQHKKSPRE